MLVIETTTIIIKTISIPMIQNTIKVSFLNYLIFFLFQFYSIYFTGIKKKKEWNHIFLHNFMFWRTLSSRICQCQSTPIKRQKSVI